MKAIRIIVSVVFLLVFVGAIGIGSLLFFIDPNKLKPVIAEQVQKNTGYGLLIEGQLSWSFYPRVGIKVEHIALYSPKQNRPFIDLHNVIFVTELKELLHGKQALRGDIYIASIKLASALATEAHVGLNWKDNILTLAPMTANFYTGTVSGAAHGRDLAALPHWDWDIQFKQVQIKPLLQDINGVDSKLKIAGLGNLTFQAQSQGKSQEQILNNLNGAFVYNITNGIVEGMDLNYFVQSAEAIINKQPLSTPTNLNETQFDSLVGAATIRNGMAEINTLTLTSPAFITRAHGSVNLPYQAVNLQLQITSQQEAKTQWAIPVMLTGSMARPDVRLDLTELNIMVAKKDLEKMKSKVHDEVARHLSGDAKVMMNKLLGE